MAGRESEDRELIMASIDQKISDLHPVRFTAAVNLKENRKFLKYALVPAAVMGGVVFAAPAILKEGMYSLVHNDRFFKMPPPFNFIFLIERLRTIQTGDFTVNLNIKGADIRVEVNLGTKKDERVKM